MSLGLRVNLPFELTDEQARKLIDEMYGESPDDTILCLVLEVRRLRDRVKELEDMHPGVRTVYDRRCFQSRG